MQETIAECSSGSARQRCRNFKGCHTEQTPPHPSSSLPTRSDHIQETAPLNLYGDWFRFYLYNDKALEWQFCAIQLQNSNPKCLLSKNQMTHRTSGDHWHWKTLILGHRGAFVSQASTSFHFIHHCLMEIIDFFAPFFTNEKHLWLNILSPNLNSKIAIKAGEK